MSCQRLERREQYDETAFNNFSVENFTPKTNNNLANIDDAHQKSAEMERFESKFAHLTSQIDIYSDDNKEIDNMNVTSKQKQLGDLSEINTKPTDNVSMSQMLPTSQMPSAVRPITMVKYIEHPDPVEDLVGIKSYRIVNILLAIIIFMIVLKIFT